MNRGCGNKAVFLDRDGTINHEIMRNGKPGPPANMEELRLIDGVKEALARLKSKGFLLIIVTNQPDVARGTMERNDVEVMNAYLRNELPLDEICVCYDDTDASPRRKPNPGMLLDSARQHGIALSRSFMVGDRWKDVVAGRRAGCRTVFLDNGHVEKKPDPPADFTATSLREATEWILSLGG